MTDRYYAFVVTLKKDMRDDDAQAICNALAMISGVLSVEPVGADPWEETAFKARAREAVRAALVRAMGEMSE